MEQCMKIKELRELIQDLDDDIPVSIAMVSGSKIRETDNVIPLFGKHDECFMLIEDWLDE